MTATALVRPDKVVADTASIRAEGGKVDARPATTASCLNRLQPPLPPPHPAGGLCLVEREASACRKSWSRRTVQTTHDKPNDTARVSEGQPGKRGRSRELRLVGRISLRRELGSNPAIGTAELTIREGHVPSYGDKERVRKICACCSAVRNTWDQFPEHSSFTRPRGSMGRSLRPESVSYSLIQHGHKRLCGVAAEPEPQDQPRKKTGNPTAPAFNRVYNQSKPPLSSNERGANPKKYDNKSGVCAMRPFEASDPIRYIASPLPLPISLPLHRRGNKRGFRVRAQAPKAPTADNVIAETPPQTTNPS